MADTSKADLKKEIQLILKDADLDNTSAKKVRLELQEKLDCDLTERKKEVDQLVMEVIDEQEEESEEESEEEEEAVKKPEKRKAGGSDSDGSSGKERASRGAATKKKKAAPKRKKKVSDDDSDDDSKPKKKKGNAFTKPIKLSEELADIVGGDEMPRHEVVKRMWAYIKENELQDPKNKQIIICDEKLSKVIPTKKFKGFGMTKFLKEHMNVDKVDPDRI